MPALSIATKRADRVLTTPVNPAHGFVLWQLMIRIARFGVTLILLIGARI